MEQLNVTVYKTETQIIITGIPQEDDESHNCDAMGCRQEHVLYRFKIVEDENKKQVERAADTARRRTQGAKDGWDIRRGKQKGGAS